MSDARTALHPVEWCFLGVCVTCLAVWPIFTWGCLGHSFGELEDRGKQIWWRCIHTDISELSPELIIFSEEISWFSPEEILKVN